MTSDPIDAHLRMHRATVLTAVIAIAPVTLMLAVLTSANWLQGLAIGAALGGGFFVLHDWNADRAPRQAIYLGALAFAYLIWVVCAVMELNPLGFFGLALLGGVLIPGLPRRQIVAAVSLGGVAAATGALCFISAPFDLATLVKFVLMPGGLTIFVAAVILVLERQRAILRDLERAGRAEAELGIMRERMRFASDLHDIQGHTLHVVNLKVALAEELLTSDVDRARSELREVFAEVENTIARTKELAYGQRRLNLNAELENARNLFEAAGVNVRIVREDREDSRNDELLGQVLREATTNILRHAQPTQVRIELSANGVKIVNDGVNGSPTRGLSGLAVLRDRLAADGGQLLMECEHGCFSTAAQFPVSPQRESERSPA